MKSIDLSINNFPKIHEFMPKKELEYGIHISLNNSYIYFETPKVACTTIKAKLQEIEARLEGVILSENRPLSDIHQKKKSVLLSPSDIGYEKFYQMLNDNKVTKFCFVRNPYTRTLSAFLNKIDRPKKATPQKQKIERILGLDIDTKITFKQFISAVNQTDPFDMDPHWRPQTKQLFWGSVNYNFIGYFENLTQDFDEILKKLYSKVVSDENLFQLRNSPTNKTGANHKLTKFYDFETKRLVQKIYQKDFLNFNYSTVLPN